MFYSVLVECPANKKPLPYNCNGDNDCPAGYICMVKLCCPVDTLGSSINEPPQLTNLSIPRSSTTYLLNQPNSVLTQ